MNNNIKCFDPNCKGNQNDLRYVCRMMEYHVIDSMPTEYGHCDLLSLEESHNDFLFKPYITCYKCNKDFNLDGTEKD